MSRESCFTCQNKRDVLTAQSVESSVRLDTSFWAWKQTFLRVFFFWNTFGRSTFRPLNEVLKVLHEIRWSLELVTQGLGRQSGSTAALRETFQLNVSESSLRAGDVFMAGGMRQRAMNHFTRVKRFLPGRCGKRDRPGRRPGPLDSGQRAHLPRWPGWGVEVATLPRRCRCRMPGWRSLRPRTKSHLEGGARRTNQIRNI